MNTSHVRVELDSPGLLSQLARLFAVPLVFLLLFATSGEGQEPATITGEVVDARSGSPIASAQVYIADLDLGGLTRSNGRFLITNVPPGTHQISVERIGYGTATQSVSVSGGESAQVDFQLQQEALGLDEIVVTGTAGQARRRELGNSVSQLNLDDEVMAPPPSMDGLLQGRVPGLQVEINSGQIGDGGSIQLRGNVSGSLSNQPLIYLDGVRIKSEPYPNLTPSPLGTFTRTFVTASPLNDLNPADIERVEIVKGAAATTLYGSEAAAGVIQIFTKQGTEGQTVWEASVEQGVSNPNKYGVRETVGGVDTDTFEQARRDFGGHVDYMFHDPWLRNGHQQEYSLSVRGRTDALSYYVSGKMGDRENLFIDSGQQSYSFRSNTRLNVTDGFSLDWMSMYSSRDVKNVPCGNNVQGVCMNAPRAPNNYIASGEFEELNKLVTMRDDITQLDRLVTGTTLRYQGGGNLSGKLVLGYDRAEMNGTITADFGHPSAPEGYRALNESLQEMVSLDFSTTYEQSITDDISADVSTGFQWVKKDNQFYEGYTEDFPGPGEVTLSSGATSQARENQSRVITGGVFGQAVISFFERYFLTAGLRVDGNSAFGEDFGWARYPKLSGSWVLSDEDFWPETLGQTRLRAAWGQAGRAPGAFDSQRTWTPISWRSQSAFIPRNVGNENLGPETTSETEVGFESSLFENRLGVDFTYYRQITEDALLPVRQTPSNGAWGTQLENVGRIRNSGIEVSLDGSVIESRTWGWDLGVSVSTNHSEVLDMGGATTLSTGHQTYITEGQPLPVVQGTIFHSPDALGEPDVTRDAWIGPNSPTLMVNPSTTVRFPYGIALRARGEYNGGHYVRGGAARWALATGAPYPLCWGAFDLIESGQTDQLTQQQKLMCVRDDMDSAHFIYPMDFFKLREVSVQFPLDFIPRTSSASLTLSGTNLWRWLNEDFLDYDPESTSCTGGAHDLCNGVYEHPAPPQYYSATLRVRF